MPPWLVDSLVQTFPRPLARPEKDAASRRQLSTCPSGKSHEYGYFGSRNNVALAHRVKLRCR